MEQAKLLDVHVQIRRVYNLLGEVLDLSQQLAEAVDRNDQVTMQMLLAMREEPIRELANVQDAIRQQLKSAAAEDGERLREILNGAPANAREEKGLVEQVAVNARMLAKVRELDKHLSMKIAREKSVYAK